MQLTWIGSPLVSCLCNNIGPQGMLVQRPRHSFCSPVPASAPKSPTIFVRLLPAALAHQYCQPVATMSAVAPNKAEYDERWHRAWKRGVPPGQVNGLPIRLVTLLQQAGYHIRILLIARLDLLEAH